MKNHLAELLQIALDFVAPDTGIDIHLERPREEAHGDFSTNLAMQLARTLQTRPHEIARRLIAALPLSPWIERVEVAGGGFINFTLCAAAKTAVVERILALGDAYGRLTVGGGRKVQVEFVSANPTGPLHVGHGRGAAYGASLANLLAFAGYDVIREYYVNDAGRQIDILALSTWLRYLEKLVGKGGLERLPPFPPNAYRGGYVNAMARQLVSAHGDKFMRPVDRLTADLPEAPGAERSDAEAEQLREARLDALINRARELLDADWEYIHRFALGEQLADCRDDLAEFGVNFDVWFSEKALFDTGMVGRAIDRLQHNGHIYLQDGARWFRSTTFGDEKDRVVQRDNGSYTYFASDIAYHLNKFERGFDRVIDVWGADHHGYIARVKGAVTALDLPANALEVSLVQFAILYRNGQKVPMSTRAGEFVTLRELRNEVGNDACRFFYVLRKSDQHLDFDLDLARSQSSDNPVYYVQYAHARVCSLLAQWGGSAADLKHVDLTRLVESRELLLMGRLGAFPEIIAAAAADLAPHAVAFYLRDLAAEFHAYYNAERMLVDDVALREARLALACAVRQVIRNGMAILGVACPESM